MVVHLCERSWREWDAERKGWREETEAGSKEEGAEGAVSIYERVSPGNKISSQNECPALRETEE